MELKFYECKHCGNIIAVISASSVCFVKFSYANITMYRLGRTTMKKMYITTMPDHIGAFLKASECFARLGVNITRVSYNKAIDSHMLFIDAEGTEEQLEEAD